MHSKSNLDIPVHIIVHLYRWTVQIMCLSILYFDLWFNWMLRILIKVNIINQRSWKDQYTSWFTFPKCYLLYMFQRIQTTDTFSKVLTEVLIKQYSITFTLLHPMNIWNMFIIMNCVKKLKTVDVYHRPTCQDFLIHASKMAHFFFKTSQSWPHTTF